MMHSGGGIGDHSLPAFGRCRGRRRLRLSLRTGARRSRRAGAGRGGRIWRGCRIVCSPRKLEGLPGDGFFV